MDIPPRGTFFLADGSKGNMNFSPPLDMDFLEDVPFAFCAINTGYSQCSADWFLL